MTVSLTRVEVEKILRDSIGGASGELKWLAKYSDGSGSAEVDWTLVEFETTLEALGAGDWREE